MKRNIFIILALLTVYVCSCEKERVEPLGDCYDFPPPQGITIGAIYVEPQVQYHMPCFNPNNGNEILFVKSIKYVDSLKRSVFLCKYDITNKVETEIIRSNVYHHPDWGTLGWIIFNPGDNQVWKIKSNGDSLTQLTYEGWNLDAKFNKLGDRFVYQNIVSNQRLSLIMNLAGEVVDTLTGFNYYYGDWSGSDLIAINGGDNIMIYDYSTKEQYSIGFGGIGSYGMDFSPDSKNIVWCTIYDVNLTDVDNNSTIKLRNSCMSRRYLRPSVSIDGKIVVQREDTKMLDYDKYEFNVEHKIVIMDLSGENETVILPK